MQIIIDNQIVKLLISDPDLVLKSPLFRKGDSLRFRWPSLLKYLDLDSPVSNLLLFDLNPALLNACITGLSLSERKEDIFHIYDRLFAENLNQINALSEMKPSFLLHAIEQKRQQIAHVEILSSALTSYEAPLLENVSHTMHDLILYLAWDRMCVCMGHLFDHRSTDPKFLQALPVLRECLVESYEHILQQKRTIPSLYRMLEAFLFYEMRDENLQELLDAEWKAFSIGLQVLKSPNELADFFYIDDGIFFDNNNECYLTLDSSEKIDTRMEFAKSMLKKLASPSLKREYSLQPKKIFSLES